MLKKGPLCVLGCYLLWGVLPVFWKLLSAVDSLYVLGSRILWSAVVAGVILAARKELGAALRDVLRDKKELLRVAGAGCAITINWGVYIWAVSHNHMIDSSLAYYMNPILAILMGMLVFRERLTPLQWLSVAVTFTGLVITVIRYQKFPWVALLIGGTFAIYGAIKKKVHVEGTASTFMETLLMTPVFLLLVVWMEVQGTGAVGVLRGWQWLLLPAAGVVTTIPLLLFANGIKTTSMSLSGTLMYVNPTLQLLISVWLYGEEFTTTHAILFCFVWTGLALYMLSGVLERRKQLKDEEEPSCV